MLLIGSKDEVDVTEEVTRRMRHQPDRAHGKDESGPDYGGARSVDLIVTNDTGPAHIGAALGRPTIVIFGPTNPLTTRPFSPDAEFCGTRRTAHRACCAIVRSIIVA